MTWTHDTILQAGHTWKDATGEFPAAHHWNPPAAALPDERLREAGERLAQAVARVCGEGHPALGMWRVALAAADREKPDEDQT